MSLKNILFVGLVTDKSLSTEEDLSNWDPPSNLLPKECQFPNTTAEAILMRLQYQVKELLGIMETNMNWPASKGPRDDQLLVEGLENILVMKDRLYNIIMSLREEISRDLNDKLEDIITSIREEISRDPHSNGPDPDSN